jgi:hypothetical protein
MYIIELFEAQDPTNTLVIYPGRFQPWHKGHKAVYDHLVKTFGRDNVFIATSNKVDPPRSPFSFGEKIQFMQLTGVPMDRVVETKDPYKALEIVQKYNPQTTRLIFAVSEKDMAEDPRFKFGYKKDGSPTYLQALPKDKSNVLPFEQHGYVITVPTIEFTVLGKPMISATEVRRQFAEADDETQRSIIKDLFGRYSPEIHSLMKHKITLNENYEYKPPGGSARQTQAVLNKIQQSDPNRNKFIWKKPNQIGGSFTTHELISRGFKFSERYNVWGGTQAMWDRLMPKENTLNRPTPTPQELMKKFNLSAEELIRQLKLGVKTELEHTKDPKVAYEIALDHLSENPNYYSMLTQVGLEEFAPPNGNGGDDEKSYLLQLASDLYDALYGPNKNVQEVKNVKAKIEAAGGKLDITFNPDGSFNVIMYHPKYFKQGYLIRVVGNGGQQGVAEDAAGVGVIAKNKKMARDPRYSMSMTQDVKPGQDLKNLRAMRLIK